MRSPAESFPLLESGSESRIGASQIAIETFVRRNRFQWIYILLFNLGGQLLVSRLHPLWQWKLFTAVDLLLCLFRLPLDLKLRHPSGLTIFNVRLLMIFAIVHPFTMAFMISSSYLLFGFDQIDLLATLLLVGYTFVALILTRSNLRVSSSVSVAFTLLPALTALWIGEFAGYAIGAGLLFVLLFCLLQGRLENAEFWRLLHVIRDLQMVRRRAEAAVHIKDEWICKHTCQTAIAGERARIAAEWHDTLLAGFSAIAWQLDLAEADLAQDPTKAAHAISLARTMLHHYRTESRLVIADLLSDMHDAENLEIALSRALEPLSQNRSVSVTVTTQGGDLILPSDKTHQVLRICQEAVSNAIQHANPQSIQIVIRNEPQTLSVEVQDDGSGFDTQATVPGHYGLEIMKDRARRIGAHLEIQSTPGSGAKLSLRIPLTESPKTPAGAVESDSQESLSQRMDHNSPQDGFTPRERDVLEQLVLGLPNRDIGLRLGIAEKTVRVHLTSIFSKLGTSDRTQAATLALQRGIVGQS